MKARWNHWAMFTVMAAIPLASFAAQPAAAPAAKPVAAQPKKLVDPIAPLPEGTEAPAPAQPEPAPLPPPPPPLWQVQQAQSLLTYINNIGREGLSPADYDPAGLISAMSSGDPMVLAQAATDRFNKLSSDLALGHVRGDARIGWFVVGQGYRRRQPAPAA